MPATWSSWLGRAAVAVLVGAAALLAWIEGGGADARGRPPPPDAERGGVARPYDAGATGNDAYEVRTRLVEVLGDAVIQVPSLAASRPSFQAP